MILYVNIPNIHGSEFYTINQLLAHTSTMQHVLAVILSLVLQLNIHIWQSINIANVMHSNNKNWNKDINFMKQFMFKTLTHEKKRVHFDEKHHYMEEEEEEEEPMVQCTCCHWKTLKKNKGREKKKRLNAEEETKGSKGFVFQRGNFKTGEREERRERERKKEEE